MSPCCWIVKAKDQRLREIRTLLKDNFSGKPYCLLVLEITSHKQNLLCQSRRSQRKYSTTNQTAQPYSHGQYEAPHRSHFLFTCDTIGSLLSCTSHCTSTERDRPSQLRFSGELTLAGTGVLLFRLWEGFHPRDEGARSRLHPGRCSAATDVAAGFDDEELAFHIRMDVTPQGVADTFGSTGLWVKI